MNEQTLKALSLIAAELHIQNHISVANNKGIRIDHSIVSETMTPKLADHFMAYFEGGSFSPNSAMQYNVGR